MSGYLDHDDEDDIALLIPWWKRRSTHVAAAITIGAVIVMIYAMNHKPVEHEPAAEKTQQRTIAAITPYQPPPPPPPPEATAQAAPPPPPPTPQFVKKIEEATRQTTRSSGPSSPAMVAYSLPQRLDATPANAGAGASQPAAQTTIAFKAGTIPGVKSSAAIDETFMLKPGMLLCVLDTALSSDAGEGSFFCHLPGPVYSKAGVKLMEADSQIVGSYQAMRAGQGDRLRATTLSMNTPNGVWVQTDEQFADPMGRNGLPADVDHKYFQRFGAATILALSDSALNILQASVSKGGNTYLQLGGGNALTSLAQTILQHTIDIPPTATLPAGSLIAITITKPIDFSPAYKLRITQ